MKLSGKAASIAGAACALLLLAKAAPAVRFELSIDEIMRGPGLVGYPPEGVRWSGDSQRIYFQWKRAGEAEEKPFDTYVVGRDGGGLRKLSDEDLRIAPPRQANESRDHQRLVYSRDGDIFLYDRATDKTRQVTHTTRPETDPHFTQDQKHIYFTAENNLFVMSLDDGSIAQMTDIRPAGTVIPDPDKKGTASQEYLKQEQKKLLDVVKEREELRLAAEAKRKKENPRKPYVLKKDERIETLRLSPDEKWVIASITEPGEGAHKTAVPNYVTASGYTEEIPSRTKVGDKQERERLYVFNAATGERKAVETGLKKAAKPGEKEQPRELEMYNLVWSDDGTKAAILAHADDNKDRWVLALDPAEAKTRVLASEHNDAWVDGPGAYMLGWMKNDREVYFQSERTGYSQLYVVAYDGGEPRALTSGNWEVRRVLLSPDKTEFLLETSEAGAGERQCYEMSTDGGGRKRITFGDGEHGCVPSPDGKSIADVYSYTNKPPELYVQDDRPGAEAKKLTSSPAGEYWQYPWADPEEFEMTSRDGAQVHAKLYKPKRWKRGGPGVIFVHGAGYLQDVDKGWSVHYYREQMFHNFLTEHGYIVMEVDYRGSAGYGRDWRTAIYQHMGGKDLDDNVDAAHWLVEHEGANPKHIGIYGGSYGGFITLMAMFTQPDIFAAGAALRPVSDWANYNDGYTSDILNLPQNDPKAYQQSSPIYFADGLKGALLICQGMRDTNVHFSDTVRLVQKLIELRKQNWDLAVYPAEDHAFVVPSSWADEYKRIFALFEKNLKPAGK